MRSIEISKNTFRVSRDGGATTKNVNAETGFYKKKDFFDFFNTNTTSFVITPMSGSRMKVTCSGTLEYSSCTATDEMTMICEYDDSKWGNRKFGKILSYEFNRTLNFNDGKGNESLHVVAKDIPVSSVGTALVNWESKTSSGLNIEECSFISERGNESGIYTLVKEYEYNQIYISTETNMGM